MMDKPRIAPYMASALAYKLLPDDDGDNGGEAS